MYLAARLFYNDIDQSRIWASRTVMPRQLKSDHILWHREQFFRDVSGQSNLVLISGIPSATTLGNMTYMAQVMMKDEEFEWAYEWKNRPGSGEHFEPNVVPVGNGYTGHLMKLTL